jgi:glycerol-3-phosphate acyltransferase PlsY
MSFWICVVIAWVVLSLPLGLLIGRIIGGRDDR